MKSYIDVLLELKRDNERYFKNFEHYARIAKEVARKELGEVRVFIFGSVVTRNYTPASDIDLIIVSKNMPKKLGERAKIKAKIYQKIGFFSPFEIHMVNEREFGWYEKFMGKRVEV